METLVKALELGAKYAWAVFIVSGFVLLTPDEVATRLDILTFRKENAGYFWLTLLFTGVLAISDAAAAIREFLWQYLICPIQKLAFPARDLRSGIKQSRFRYFSVQFTYRNGDKPTFFEAINSNGHSCGFFDDSGRRILPDEPNDGHVRLNEGKFQHPRWARIDWPDIFNGKMASGNWGIIER